MQQLDLSLTYLNSLTLLLSSAPLHWLPVACPHPFKNISTCVLCCERIGSSLHPGHDQTLHPSPFTSALYLPAGLLLPHCDLNTQQNHDCLLSWLLNGGMSSQMTSGTAESPIHLPPQTKNTCLPTIPCIKSLNKKICGT